jgi:hypothetical protein
LEREEPAGPTGIWNGNAGRTALTLAFADGPGTYRLWAQEEAGAESNCLEITALAAEPLPALPEDLPQARLETALPAAPVISALALAAGAQPGPPFLPRAGIFGAPAAPQGEPVPIPGVLRPDGHDVIDLVAATPPPEPEPVPNPFRVRRPASAPPREVPLLVSAVLAGAAAGQGCSVINGQLVSVGDAVEGFTLAAITADAIELRNERATLEVPVQNRPVLLRLPH